MRGREPALAGRGRLRWTPESAMFVEGRDGTGGLVSVGACAGVLAREAVGSHAAAVGGALRVGTTASRRGWMEEVRSDAISIVEGCGRGKQVATAER